MNDRPIDQKVAYDVLKKYGMKWAVMAAMRIDMARKGIRIPEEIGSDLDIVAMKIRTGCFSVCEVGCSLAEVEGKLISTGYCLGPEYLRGWTELQAKAMRGEIDPSDTEQIPALKPVETDCKLLACQCSSKKIDF